MNRKKTFVSFVTVAMLLCSSLVFPVRATPSDWSKPRPSLDTTYDERIGNSKTDGIASVGMGITIGKYSENDPGYGYKDHLSLRISTSANTRVGITYSSYEESYNFNWQEVSEPTGITDDNSGTWLDLGFTFLYYGVEYERVWVCSNGFLTLNKTSTNANPQSIPSTDEPNPVIAVFWRDLHPEQGGSITYGRDIYFNNGCYFVVSWNDVPDDNGDSQTFQVLIQNRQGWGSYDYHNGIFFQYKNITKSYPTTVGTEDQVGNKGTAYDYNNLHNQACLRFAYSIAGYRLEQLWIKLTKSDSYAKIEVLETMTGGYNVKLKDYSNPWGDDFTFAIKTAASLLLWKAGIIWKGMLIVADLAGILANDISPVKPEYTKDALESDSEAWAWGECQGENSPPLKVFDSTLATTVEWIFNDANNKDHDLTVTAEAWYRDLTNDNVYIISTSSTLNMRLLRYINIEARKTDGSAISNVNIWVDGVRYRSPVYITLTRGTHIVQAEPYFYRRVYWLYMFDHWEDDGSTNNTRIISAEDDMNLTAYYHEFYCPTLFVWNGSEYVYETLLNIHAETDITVQHQIQQTLVLDGIFYKLQLRELDNFTSHIDQVKLYAVDHNGERHTCPLTIAKLNGTYVTLKLLFDDEWRADLHSSQIIDLKFIPSIPYHETAYFIFEINGYNKKIPD